MAFRSASMEQYGTSLVYYETLHTELLYVVIWPAETLHETS
jgi:hypothetical protein